MEKIKQHKTTIILGLVILAVLVGGYFTFKSISASAQKKAQAELPDQIINVTFDPEGPYATILPRNDGDAIDLSIQRIKDFDSFSYMLDYQDGGGIERGAGVLTTWVKIDQGKTSFDQELLFGSCSKNVCKYDTGVENGTLTFQLKKANIISKINTDWHLQQPDLAKGILTSGDNHFTYTVDKLKLKDISLVKFTIIYDLSGAPKLPNGKSVLGKIYALSTPVSKILPTGVVTIELPDNPPTDAKINQYDDLSGTWKELDTKSDKNKLTAPSTGAGIFAVLVNSKN